MAKGAALRLSASIAALVYALPGWALDADPERSETTTWVPALAALGDAFARSDQDRDARNATALVPVLVSLGVDASAGSVAAGAPPAPELPKRQETERWVPALAFTSGIIGQNAEGAIKSSSTLTYRYVAQDTGQVISHIRPQGPPRQTPVLVPLTTTITRSLREGKGERFTTTGSVSSSLITGVLPAATTALPTAGKDLFLTPTVGASLELMTPGLQSVPLTPRLFIHGDATLGFAFDRNVAKEGVPDGAEIPNPVPPVYTEGQVKGVGSKTAGEVKTLIFSGGLGTALNIEMWERPLRIKPSFEFIRQEVNVTGRLTRAFRKNTGLRQTFLTNPPAAPLFTTPAAAAFIPIDLEASETKTYYGIGPGLELEMDAARAGPVMLTVFLSGQAYKMLGDPDVQLQASQVINDPALVPNNQTVSASFDFTLHSWAYRGGVGLRFRWLPED